MGLDQYLTATRHMARYEYMLEDADPKMKQAYEQASAVLDAAGLTDFQQPNNSVELKITVGYWRKANQIHNWFVREVQDGNDDCREYLVTREQIESLRETVAFVLASSELVPDMVVNGQTLAPGATEWKNNLEPGEVVLDPKVAEDLLPTTSGFFFGSTDYDQWYVADLILTMEICERSLELLDADPSIWLYYESSW